jgi:hypothetical protein
MTSRHSLRSVKGKKEEGPIVGERGLVLLEDLFYRASIQVDREALFAAYRTSIRLAPVDFLMPEDVTSISLLI